MLYVFNHCTLIHVFDYPCTLFFFVGIMATSRASKYLWITHIHHIFCSNIIGYISKKVRSRYNKEIYYCHDQMDIIKTYFILTCTWSNIFIIDWIKWNILCWIECSLYCFAIVSLCNLVLGLFRVLLILPIAFVSDQGNWCTNRITNWYSGNTNYIIHQLHQLLHQQHC